jgi:hypothetical protein
MFYTREDKMKRKKLIIVVFIVILLLIIVFPPIKTSYEEKILKNELKAAVEDYAIEYCQKRIKLETISLSYSWTTGFWVAKSKPEIQYLSGEIIEGRVHLNNAPCTEHRGFILNRDTQEFIKYEGLFPPKLPHSKPFNIVHPVEKHFYMLISGASLITIIFLLIWYYKLHRKEKSVTRD